MKALILAAGFGVRLREIIHGRPKHLALINGQPFLRHLVKLLKQKGIKQIVIAVGYLAQFIIDEFTRNDQGIKIRFSEDHRPLGTAGSIKKAQRYFTDDFIIINGDTYLDIDYHHLFQSHKKASALLTIVGTSKHRNKGGIIINQGKNIIDFIPDHQKQPPAHSYRNAGVYVASPKLFNYIPSFTKISLEKDIIPRLLKTKQTVQVYPINKTFIDIGSVASFMQAEKALV